MDSLYLSRYATQKTYIEPDQYGNCGIIVIVPCHDEPDLIGAIEALEECQETNESVMVIVVINASQEDTDDVKNRNARTLERAKQWAGQNRKHKYRFILDNELPKKYAGVGLARKIGMDEAVRIFERFRRDGVIICFDADSNCQHNLLLEVENLFQDENIPGCSIHFEHPVEGKLQPEVYEGITRYELHLRYFIHAQRYSGFPNAFHTIGSSMAVRSSTYQKVGGMNRRKAGEDFYFLHKIIPISGFKELSTTMVIPSPRISNRVPFGTGRAVGDWIKGGQEKYLTYNPNTFEDLKVWFSCLEELYRGELEKSYSQLPASIRGFVNWKDFKVKIEECLKHSTSLFLFKKRFFQWFDAFKLMKFVHHSRDFHNSNVSLEEAAQWLLRKREISPNNEIITLLKQFRYLDREQKFTPIA